MIQCEALPLARLFLPIKVRSPWSCLVFSQIAYLENLLKVYNDEIYRLQHAELNLDDLGAEDSLYIQEHKLKRKMIKIYEKLCELKSCSTLTGRVIEQRIRYNSTRYPEINKKVSCWLL
ncbi:death domain-associated protein 6-like [Gasterosteus aculeatus]